jgi:hypothetical protein
MDPRIRIRIHTKMSWIRNPGFRQLGIGPLHAVIKKNLMYRPQMKNSINCILIGLASFDIVLISTSILMFGIPSIYTHSIIQGYVV